MNAETKAKTDTNSIMLETGKITFENTNYTQRRASVLIDRGSMLSYIRRDIVEDLQLIPHSKRTLLVNGFGGHSTKRSFDVVNIGIVTSKGLKNIDFLVTDEIVKPIESQGWKECLKYDYISELKLADDFSEDNLIVDSLIGCDNAFHFLDSRVIKGDGPTVQYSNLGCFVSGPLRGSELCMPRRVQLTALSTTWNVRETFMIATSNDEEVQDEDKKMRNFVDSNVIDFSDTMSEDEHHKMFKHTFLDRIEFHENMYH